MQWPGSASAQILAFVGRRLVGGVMRAVLYHPGKVFAMPGISSRSQLGRVLQAAIPATLAGIAAFQRDAVTSCQTPPFRLRLLPLAWPGAVSAM
jgi:hypothetical protein